VNEEGVLLYNILTEVNKVIVIITVEAVSISDISDWLVISVDYVGGRRTD